MTELKPSRSLRTLKDMRVEEDHVWFEKGHDEDCIGCERNGTLNQVRSEAIKWVKEDRDDLVGIFPPLRVEKLKDIERWMKRLNITEKDLA